MSGVRALLVSSTVDGEDRARELASALVEEGLAACLPAYLAWLADATA
ncbi:hypothetical protein HRbin12_00483 [bacterium HR12]|nr:hypothetical protein HRbin12_00483 [bacterium HR12]